MFDESPCIRTCGIKDEFVVINVKLKSDNIIKVSKLNTFI